MGCNIVQELFISTPSLIRINQVYNSDIKTKNVQKQIRLECGMVNTEISTTSCGKAVSEIENRQRHL